MLDGQSTYTFFIQLSGLAGLTNKTAVRFYSDMSNLNIGSGNSLTTYFANRLLSSLKILKRPIHQTTHTHTAIIDNGRQQLPPSNKTTSGSCTEANKIQSNYICQRHVCVS